MNIPAGQQAVMPYLVVSNAQAFIDFVKTIFHGELTYTAHARKQPMIQHAQIQINGSTIMFCDATEQWKPQNVNLFVYVDNADETYKAALEAGAASVMEPSTQNYGRTSGIKDPCGNTWWVTSVE